MRKKTHVKLSSASVFGASGTQNLRDNSPILKMRPAAQLRHLCYPSGWRAPVASSRHGFAIKAGGGQFIRAASETRNILGMLCP